MYKSGFRCWESLFVKEAWFLQIKILGFQNYCFFPFEFQNVFIDSIDSCSEWHLPFHWGNKCQVMQWVKFDEGWWEGWKERAWFHRILFPCIILDPMYYSLCRNHTALCCLDPLLQIEALVSQKSRIQTLSMKVLHTRFFCVNVNSPYHLPWGITASLGNLVITGRCISCCWSRSFVFLQNLLWLSFLGLWSWGWKQVLRWGDSDEK